MLYRSGNWGGGGNYKNYMTMKQLIYSVLTRRSAVNPVSGNYYVLLPPPPQESREGVAEEEQDILPGGDPDAGIPTDQARIHGIERGPHIPEQNSVPEHLSYVPSEDNVPVDVETHIEDTTNTDLSSVTQPPDSD